MTTQALGLIETIGYLGAVEAADAMTKSANVQLLGYVKPGASLVAVLVQGDVGAVKASVAAGAVAAQAVGAKVVSCHVIARPHEAVASLLPKP